MKNRIVTAVMICTGCLLVLLMFGCTIHPEITVEDIQQDIVGVTTSHGSSTIKFTKEDPRKITIVETDYSWNKAEIVIEMESEMTSLLVIKSKMSGKLRLHYEWIAEEWNLLSVDNLTFREM